MVTLVTSPICSSFQGEPPTPPRFRKIAVSFLLFALLLSPGALKARDAQAASRYDLVYIWDNDLNSLQDYREELENQLGAAVSKKLRFVQRDNHYGIIYDCDATPFSATKTAIHHNAILNKAGMGDARPIEDEGYDELFNVCYGQGPNLAALTEQYQRIYGYLGSEIGKNLYIEKNDEGKYTLIYRWQANRQSTMNVARRHAELLAKIGISASITREESNEVVFGESSLLDHVEKSVDAASPPLAPASDLSKSRDTPSKPLRVISGANKKLAHKIITPNRSNLEKQLEEYIHDLRSRGEVARDEKTGWLVIDLTKGETLVSINVDKPYQAASMIKPFIALAFFQRLKEGKLVYGRKSREKMEAMIQHSSNAATNWVLRQVGGPKAAQKILKRHYGHLFKETSIVEYIPSGGRTYRNKASATDYGRFLVALWRNQLPSSKELRRLMALPGRDRLYCGTSIPQGTLVYNKTGTTAKLCGDMGILAPRAKNGRRYPYVLVGIIEKGRKAGNYGRWGMARGNVIRQVSLMVYQEMKSLYNLL